MDESNVQVDPFLPALFFNETFSVSGDIYLTCITTV